MKKLILVFSLIVGLIAGGCETPPVSQTGNEPKTNETTETNIYQSQGGEKEKTQQQEETKKQEEIKKEEEKKENQSNENAKEVQQNKTPYEYWQKSILNKKCEISSLNKDTGYAIWNDCLYKDGVLIQDENLNNLVVKKGNEKYKNFLNNHQWGEDVIEWFRFKIGKKIRIFLLSGRGCGGCIYTGPYLEINTLNDEVVIQFADLPYRGNVINSPDNKLGVFLDVEHFHTGPTDIYLYDFLNLQNKGRIYTVLKEHSVQICGDGCYISKDAIKWLDNSRIEIHLMQRNEDGLVYGDNKVFFGEPFVIDSKLILIEKNG